MEEYSIFMEEHSIFTEDRSKSKSIFNVFKETTNNKIEDHNVSAHTMIFYDLLHNDFSKIPKIQNFPENPKFPIQILF